MIAKKNSTGEEGKKRNVKVGKLQRNRDLTASEQKQVKGSSGRKEMQQKLREKQQEIQSL